MCYIYHGNGTVISMHLPCLLPAQLLLVHFLNILYFIDVYFQQMQGIDLLIHLNELLHYSMAHYRACETWREF